MFNGSLVALITPFKNGAVDEKGFEKFVAWQIKEGTDGLVPCGTTGESPTLSDAEHLFVIQRTVAVARGRVPVVAGTGSFSTLKTAATCRQLLAGLTHLFTFTRVEGVEPTNNDAERALRHAVIYRKTSGGTDSKSGSRFVECILSVVATCRQQNIDVLDYLTRCFQSHLDGTPTPSLLPQKATAQKA